MRTHLWERLLLALIGLKLLGALLGTGWGVPSSTDRAEAAILSQLVLLLPLLAYALGGSILWAGSRGDRRAAHLGLVFLLLATAYSNRPLLQLVSSEWGGLGYPALLLSSLHLDAFLPYFFWRFAGEFPTSPLSYRTRRLVSAGSLTALAVGAALLALELGQLLLRLLTAAPGAPLGVIAPPKPSFFYYGVVLTLTVLALALLLGRARTAPEEERRRVWVFAAGLAGMAPLFLLILTHALIFAAGQDFSPPLPLFLVAFVLFCSVPFTTGYAVLVTKVLNVRLIARRAVQYAFARYTAIGLAVVPLAAISIYLYRQREQRLEEIFSGTRLPLLVSAAIVGFSALRYRKTLLDSIDRQFFREQYDARRILTLLVERIRATNGVDDLSLLITREVDLALHPEGVSLLAFEPRSGVLADPRNRSRRLDISSDLANLIAGASDPLTVDLEDARSPLAKLPEKERHWLVDSGYRLIVPILARDGSLLGLLGIGEKKSGLPFLKEDRQLLRAIANSAAWALELEQSKSLGSSRSSSWQDSKGSGAGAADSAEAPSPAAAELAKECPNCGRLYQAFTVFCSSCSRKLEASHVPFVLPGKFRFERRIGVGGMGIVYRGSDLSLGRPVAVKTLRRVSPEDAMRLRREARTAAAVSHPHLAPVYGMETWQGTPMLVMELLEGGTLSQKIEKGRLDPMETVELGLAMAEALAQLHAADILHRDIKPSNIGYTRGGVPKLMDFGIARVMFDLRRDTDFATPADLDEDSVLLSPTSLWNRTPTSLTVSRQLVGTLGYLSPEALNGQPADASFDLWSLAVVLYECLLGRKIFSGGDMQQLMNRIRHGRVPEFSQVLPEYEEALGEFFRSALHKTLSRRPATARELKERLAATRSRLAA
ncbi:MAG TPA: serine/threonine-protein kinase [Thermoanaerobaculia bacterium]|nr:serine/threonine-protein kinase [Thermoanaerobaculia bacterium]